MSAHPTTNKEADAHERAMRAMLEQHDANHRQRSQREVRDQQKRAQRIPRNEQDEDSWRFERPMPGRDPVTEERGMGG
jgi:hypothetical protein